MQTTINQRLDNFVILPRWVASKYRDGEITRHERDVYLWLRANGNPYGFVTVSLEGLAQDSFGKSTYKNYTNKVLLSLKRQRLIYYKVRKGCRGSFDIHFGDWPTPDKDQSGNTVIKQLDRFFDPQPSVRTPVFTTLPMKSEQEQKKLPVSQKLEKRNVSLKPDVSTLANKLSVRSSYNDTDTETYKDNDHRSFKNKLLVKTFEPNSYQEEQCKLIAETVGDVYMDFILASVRKHGWLCVERTWKFTKDSTGFVNASNKAAYFNAAIQRFSKVLDDESQSI